MPFDVRRLDVYRKVPKDLTQPTVTGAIISVCSLSLIVFLFISELLAFISTETTSELFVDSSADTDKIPVRLNISLPRLSCSVVGLDIQDENGRHEVGFVDNTEKIVIGENGQGCRFESQFQVNKVPGNFHVSTHSAHTQPKNIDMTHLIHEVTFGDPMNAFSLDASFNPLRQMDKTGAQAVESHEYHMKIVPTIYEDLSGRRTNGYQYTYAYKSHVAFTHHGIAIPAIWFRYDLTPITVKYTTKRKPLYSFVTMVCAIVGGTFSVAAFIDTLIFTASNLFKKFELGKLS